MKCFQALFALAVILLTMLSCGSPINGAAPLTSASTVENYKPTASDLRGSPMILTANSFEGKCAFMYMDGRNSGSCDASLTASQTSGSVSLALTYKIDNKQSEITPVVLAVNNNLLYDSQRNIVGSIGSAALRFQNNELGLMSVRQMPNGTLAVLVQQVPGMSGDSLTNGFSFVSSMK